MSDHRTAAVRRRLRCSRRWIVIACTMALLNSPHLGRAASTDAQVLMGHTGHVYSVAFAPDGTLLASAADDGTVRIWPMPAAGVGRVVRLANRGFAAAWFTKDGTTLVGASQRFDERHATIQFWDTRTWNLVRMVEGGGGWPFALSHDAKLMAGTDGYVRQRIKLWDPWSGRVVRTLVGHEGIGPRSLAFSPNDRLLASGGDDITLRVWEVSTGTQQQVITHNDVGGMGWVIDLAWSPDGHTIASASRTSTPYGAHDLTITLWDAFTGRVQRHLGSEEQALAATAFSPSGRLVAGAFALSRRGGAAYVGIWDVATGKQVSFYKSEHRGTITALTFSPDGTIFASASRDTTVRLWPVHP